MELAQLQALVELPGWRKVVEAAAVQIANRRNKYYRTPLKDGAQFEMQWELGEAAGIEFFVKLPEVIITAARAIIEEAKQNAQQTGDQGAGAST